MTGAGASARIVCDARPRTGPGVPPRAAGRPTAGATVTDARDLLRKETRGEHERVEAHPLMTRLMGCACDLATLRQVVAAHLALYRTLEPLIRLEQPRCLGRHGGFCYREPLAAADFADLQGDEALVPSCPRPDFTGNAAWTGYLYVVEGASLGGRLISDRLTRGGQARLRLSLRTFSPYGGTPGVAWRRFVEVLRTELESDASRHAAIAAARTTFRLHALLFTRAGDAAHER